MSHKNDSKRYTHLRRPGYELAHSAQQDAHHESNDRGAVRPDLSLNCKRVLQRSLAGREKPTRPSIGARKDLALKKVPSFPVRVVSIRVKEPSSDRRRMASGGDRKRPRPLGNGDGGRSEPLPAGVRDATLAPLSCLNQDMLVPCRKYCRPVSG